MATVNGSGEMDLGQWIWDLGIVHSEWGIMGLGIRGSGFGNDGFGIWELRIWEKTIWDLGMDLGIHS